MSREPYRSCTECPHSYGYCAPTRCYCGHPACTAYPSYQPRPPKEK